MKNKTTQRLGNKRLLSFPKHYSLKYWRLKSICKPGDLTASKRTGTSNRIEIQFRTFNHLLRPDSFVKLFETLCLCLAQVNEYMAQI
jgi:hypothetical protein